MLEGEPTVQGEKDRRYDDPFRCLNADELQLLEAHDHGDGSLAARFIRGKIHAWTNIKMLLISTWQSLHTMADTPPSTPASPAARPSKPVSEALLNDKV